MHACMRACMHMRVCLRQRHHSYFHISRSLNLERAVDGHTESFGFGMHALTDAHMCVSTQMQDIIHAHMHDRMLVG